MDLTLQINAELYFNINTTNIEFKTINYKINYVNVSDPNGKDTQLPSYLQPYKIILKPHHIYLVYAQTIPIYPSTRTYQDLLVVFLDRSSAQEFIKSCKTENNKYEYLNKDYGEMYYIIKEIK